MLMGRDVDYLSFSIAILDVLALFPPAAPLKAVTVPAKLAIKVLKLGNVKAVQYFGGVFKKMFQKAKGRDFSLVFQGIAFVIIIADMAKDEEGREAIKTLAGMITSTDDFFDIMDYFSLADDEIEPSETAYNSSLLFEDAYAGVFLNAGRIIGQTITKSAPLIKRAGPVATKGLGSFARSVRKLEKEAVTSIQKVHAKRLTRLAFNENTFKGILGTLKSGGLHSVRNIATGRFAGQRTSPLMLIGIIGYLEAELFIKADEQGENGSDGRLFATLDEDERQKQILQLQSVILQSLPNFGKNTGGKKGNKGIIANAHAKAFQLIQLAILHASGKDVIGIEVKRDVYLFSDKDSVGEDFNGAIPFGRDVDVMVRSANDQEIWYEQKSWAAKVGTKLMGTSVGAWAWGSNPRKSANFNEFDKKLKGSAAHRQFVLDHIAASTGATERNVEEPDESAFLPVSFFEWNFQKFNVKLKTEPDKNNPSEANIRKAFKKLPTEKTSEKGIFKAHTGINSAQSMKVGAINVGLIDALLNVFAGDFKSEVLADLKDNDINLR